VVKSHQFEREKELHIKRKGRRKTSTLLGSKRRRRLLKCKLRQSYLFVFLKRKKEGGKRGRCWTNFKKRKKSEKEKA
jgi:hypothetical protein